MIPHGPTSSCRADPALPAIMPLALAMPPTVPPPISWPDHELHRCRTPLPAAICRPRPARSRQPSRTPHDKAKPENPIEHRLWPAASCFGGYRTPAGARYPSHKPPFSVPIAVPESRRLFQLHPWVPTGRYRRGWRAARLELARKRTSKPNQAMICRQRSVPVVTRCRGGVMITTGEMITLVLGSGGLSGAINFGLTQWATLRARRRDVSHQSLLVAEHLESYAFGCAGLTFGAWCMLADGRPGALPPLPPLFQPFSDKIVWQSVDGHQAAAARALPLKAEQAAAAAQAGFGKSSTEGHVAAFAWTLRLGKEAFEVAASLRKSTGIAPLTFDYPRWDYPLFLRGEFEKLPLRREQITVEVARMEGLERQY